MTAEQFRQELSRLGFTGLEFAELLDVNDRTMRRWVSGQKPVPDGFERLREMTRDEVLATDMAVWSEVWGR